MKQGIGGLCRWSISGAGQEGKHGLEEMLGMEIPAGALFYGKSRRRQDVVFDAELRREVEKRRPDCTSWSAPAEHPLLAMKKNVKAVRS